MDMARWATIFGAATLFMLGTGAAAQSVNYDAAYARFHPTETAQDRARSPAFRRCIRASGGVTVNMRDCSAAEYDRVDVRLNDNYRRIMRRLPQSGQQQLRASQRRWLTSRWNHCDNDPQLEGGTMDLIIRDSCTLTELIRRTLWLGQL
jgi:uncharacterized protein YecT (DUF1311 family)